MAHIPMGSPRRGGTDDISGPRASKFNCEQTLPGRGRRHARINKLWLSRYPKTVTGRCPKTEARKNEMKFAASAKTIAADLCSGFRYIKIARFLRDLNLNPLPGTPSGEANLRVTNAETLNMYLVYV